MYSIPWQFTEISMIRKIPEYSVFVATLYNNSSQKYSAADMEIIM